MRSDTRSVTIRRRPEDVFDYVADINNWPDYTDFAQSVEDKDTHWIIHSPQGPVRLVPHFDRKLGLLDSAVTLSSGEEVMIPYRVVPNETGAELIMTNFQARGDSPKAYAEQLRWMEKELDAIKKTLEK